MEMEAVKYLLGLLQVLVTAWCWVMYTDIKSAKEDIATHRLHIAENYTTKSESTRAFDTLSKNLESLLMVMNQRFDKMDSKLDSKMDKGD
jgi:hypothetical protein